MPKRKKAAKRSGNKAKKTNFLARGSITIVLLIGIIIVGSVYFVRGALPDLEHIDIGERRVVVPSEEQNEGGGAQDNLQLRTIQFESCEETAAVTMQIDITGSIRTAGATNDLKNAVISFTDQMSDESVVGIQAYNSNNPRMEVIPVSLYKNVKDNIRSEVGRLNPGGSTPSYAALQYSREVLENAMPQFPERKFSFIFFSDGNPNVGPDSPEDLNRAAREIENLGVTVYAIGFGRIDRNMIETIASSSDTAFFTSNSEELEGIYAQIAHDLCESI